MLTKNINFKNFNLKKNLSFKKYSKASFKNLKSLLEEDSELIKSLKKSYKYSFKKRLIKKFIRVPILRIIGMGGSILGAEAIYNFLNFKIKKKVLFVNNLKRQQETIHLPKKLINIIISKSGNTLETILNSNVLIKKDNKNIFITENKESYLKQLAQNLKAEIVNHNNFIGGRYSVLSEVGMLPVELMGLSEKKFKQFNYLIKSKVFINNLINNVSNIICLQKKKRFNSIIINYDEDSESLFKWYQQLVAESLGKKSLGILPTVSTMPKDNHSTMQLYLDGQKNSFYTFFHVNEKNILKIDKKNIFSSHNYIKNKGIKEILFAQKKATEKIFLRKKIPFRSFEVLNRNEESMGELFSFFILETILVGRALNINPFDQPSVELIKQETKKILIRS